MGARRMGRFAQEAAKFATEYAGFGLYWAWVYLSFDSDVFLGDASVAPLASLGIHAVSCASAMAGFVLYARSCAHVQASGRVRLAAAGSAIASAATAFYALPPLSSSFLSCAAGAAVSGVGAAFLVVGWGVRFASLDGGEGVRFTAAAFLASMAVFALAAAAPAPVAGAAMTALPAASGGLLVFSSRRARKALCAEEGARGRGGRRAASAPGGRIVGVLPRRFACGLLLAMFSYGGVRALLTGADAAGRTASSFVAPGVVAAALLLAAGVWAAGRRFDASLGYRAVLPCVALACALVSAFDARHVPAAAACATAASVLMEMVTWLVLMERGRASDSPSYGVFAAGRFFVHAGMLAGEAAGVLCLHAGGGSLFAAVSTASVVVAASLLLAGGEGAAGKTRPDASDASDAAAVAVRADAPDGGRPCGDGRAARVAASASASPDVARIPPHADPSSGATGAAPGDVFDEMAASYGLTAREAEVLALWGSGFGSKYVEERLCISAATVKTHVRHIYGKVGVKSRPELMLAIEKRAARSR